MDSEQTESSVAPATPGVRPDQPAEEGLTGAALLEFRCVRNAAYHEDMERHYARIHRFLMFLVIAIGTVSLGASLVSDNRLALAGTGIAVLAGLIDVHWNIDGMARLHSALRRRSYDLLARLEANEPIHSINAEFIRIVADEPPAMHAVNALAFNAAVDALGRPKDQKYKITWWQAALRHWIRFQPNEFPTIGLSSPG